MAIQRSGSRKRLVLTGIGMAFVIWTASSLFVACSGPANPSPAKQQPALPLTSESVKKLFNTKCAICHGENGKMQYAGAKDLTLTTMSEAEIAAQIKYGKGSMPPQQGIINDEEIQALARYTLQLPK